LPCGPVSGRIRPPGSKSITNRALICAAFAKGTSLLRGALDSEDTRVMIGALRQLGIAIRTTEPEGTVEVIGCAGRPTNPQAELHVANSGTTMRFLAAMLAAVPGNYRLDGIARMRERPIGDLLAALRSQKVDACGELRAEYPPIRIRSTGLSGGEIHVRGDVSSQFLSGLLLAAPYAQHDVRLQVAGELVSRPYVDMTLAVMQVFGITSQVQGDGASFFVAAPRCYQAAEYAIEPDASAASYFWATAAVTGGSVLVEGLDRNSLQGDTAFCECLQRMGCTVEVSREGTRVRGGKLTGIDVDMNAISDTVQTLSAVALFAEGPTRIRGVAHIRHKETDRIGDLARELRKFGARVQQFEDGLRITPGKLCGAEIETYHDHRMAMSLALVGLRQENVVIRDPRCVEKTYPEYFHDLQRLCGTAEE
jgi:3-phosphoshikimate 1-carboxyvinyltransferase